MNASDRRNPSSVMELLASTGLFNVLDEATLKAVESALEPVCIPGGEILLRQGDPGDSLYILIYGRLQISVRTEDGGEEVVGEVGRGEVVGEMSVLTGEPRSATARAIRDSELVRFTKDSFERVIGSNSQAMLMVARRLVSRLRKTMHPFQKTRLNTLAIVSLDPGLPLSDFSAKLATAFAKTGSTLHLNSALLRQKFGGDPGLSETAGGQHKVSVWLDDQERLNKYVVYEADLDFTPWTRHCIRQADRILLISRAGFFPEGSARGAEFEELCSQRAGVRRDLVLLHRDGSSRPNNTARWLALVPGRNTHHHLRSGSLADFDRLSRMLTGEAVGLTLGGGGARGLAHLGVIRALEESGIPIDVIGGTSMGSVIAAQYALGMSYQEMIDINRRGWIDLDPFRDKTIPIMAILSCRKLDRMLEMMFGDARIEDLWLKFFCVSANLTRAEMNVHTEGSLARAVRSSLAIPGVAVPVFEKGDLVVDGGVLNNLPGDVMGRICGGTVIVVDVGAQKDLSIDPHVVKAPSPWKILWSRINPLGRAIDAPGILSIMMRTIMIGSLHNSNRMAQHADLYIRPAVDRHGMFDWKSIDEIVQSGYESALAAIGEWKRPKEQP